MIHPELINRIEMSLHKRLQGDIRPHLLRYSTRANNVGEFVAMAARLLTDTRQRQRWMETWALRLRIEIAASNSLKRPEGPTLETTGPFEFNTSQLRNMREAVSQEMGPITMLMVKAELALQPLPSENRDEETSPLEMDGRRPQEKFPQDQGPAAQPLR